jgi:hypothetical protein
MIRHIVFFSAKNPHDVHTIMDGLERLGNIPQVRNFCVRKNLKFDSLGNDIDIVVYGEFESTESLQAYKEHPLYQESISIVRPLRELRFCTDTEI